VRKGEEEKGDVVGEARRRRVGDRRGEREKGNLEAKRGREGLVGAWGGGKVGEGGKGAEEEKKTNIKKKVEGREEAERGRGLRGRGEMKGGGRAARKW